MIDTSTTKGKIEVMQAYEVGKKIQAYRDNVHGWGDFDNLEPSWKWGSYNYRIKPQTLEESANKYFEDTDDCEGWRKGYVNCFRAGAKWQKDQDNV